MDSGELIVNPAFKRSVFSYKEEIMKGKILQFFTSEKLLLAFRLIMTTTAMAGATNAITALT